MLKRLNTAVASWFIPLVLVSALSCAPEKSHDRPTSEFRLPQGFVAAQPGRFAVVASVPSDDIGADARSNLIEPTEILPANDGGIVVVSAKTPSIFTWITRDGTLKPFITRSAPKFDDGLSPSYTVSAHQESLGSAIIITESGQIARVTGDHAIDLGRLPRKGGGSILTLKDKTMLIQQRKTTYEADISKVPIDLRKKKIAGIGGRYALAAVSRDGSAYFATDGDSVIAVDAKGKTIWKSLVERDDSVTMITPDDKGGAWVGDIKGGLFHITSGGKMLPIAPAGRLARSCSPIGETPPVGEVYAMLLRGDQLYIADRRCDRIIAYGISNS